MFPPSNHSAVALLLFRRIKRTVLCARALIIYSSYRAKKLVQRIVLRLYSCIQGPATCNRSSVTRWMIVRLCAENPCSIFSFRTFHTKHMKHRPRALIKSRSLFGPQCLCFIDNSFNATVGDKRKGDGRLGNISFI